MGEPEINEDTKKMLQEIMASTTRKYIDGQDFVSKNQDTSKKKHNSLVYRNSDDHILSTRSPTDIVCQCINGSLASTVSVKQNLH